MNFEVQLQKYETLESLFMIMKVHMKEYLVIKCMDMVYLNGLTVVRIKVNRKMETLFS